MGLSKWKTDMPSTDERTGWSEAELTLGMTSLRQKSERQQAGWLEEWATGVSLSFLCSKRMSAVRREPGEKLCYRVYPRSGAAEIKEEKPARLRRRGFSYDTRN